MNNLTLSISTIKDLLLRNRISKDRNNKPIEDVNLCIPEYQRPYKWSVRNAIQLLDDITEACNENKEIYRVGTLILHKEVTKEGKTIYNIVDGQQRTITFSLLLYVIYEGLRDSKNPEVLDIPFLKQSLSANPDSRRNIPNNLNALRRRLIKKGDDEDKYESERSLRRLKDYVENRCELIVIITDDISEAFQFFDSQNARGKALYPHDLLKAYHLREMTDVDDIQTEKIVRSWEKIPQYDLASFFGDYLYRLKEWLNGNWADILDERNLHKFKGITKSDRTPFAQFYKSAFSYANMVNSSAMPFVSGTREVNAFQLNAPIIAGKPFFDYTRHYYDILKDIQDNSKYEGFYITDNQIVKTLDKYFNRGTGNRIARLIFDTALLLYVDRFCPATYPTKDDIDIFEQFVVYAFIWAYSLRAQYSHLGWQSAQNYVLGYNERKNSLNIYKLISEADHPVRLLSTMADRLTPLTTGEISDKKGQADFDAKEDDGIYKNYMHFFKLYSFLS